MKYKIICEVSLPEFEYVLDVNIPYNKTVYYVCKMLDNIIKENIYPNYEGKNNAKLIDSKTGLPFDMNNLVSETTIRNGSKLTYY